MNFCNPYFIIEANFLKTLVSTYERLFQNLKFMIYPYSVMEEYKELMVEAKKMSW